MLCRLKLTEQALLEAMNMVNGVACCIAKAAVALEKIISEAIKQCISAVQGISQAELEDRDEGRKRMENWAKTVGFAQSIDTCGMSERTMTWTGSAY
jgi:cell division protein FtsX